MAGGYIKIHRKITEWEWYGDPCMVTLWIHLLLTANWEDRAWQGTQIPRGSLVTGRERLAAETGMSVQKLRTCLHRLEKTGEITIKSTNRFSVVTICKYEDYQIAADAEQPANEPTNNQQSTSNQPHNKNIKNIKKIRNKEYPSFNSSQRSESQTGIEEEKEKILEKFFFENLASPEEEVEKFLGYNEDWAGMSPERKATALAGWKQQPQQAPRFRRADLEMWRDFYTALSVSSAPADIRHAALSDKIDFQRGSVYFILTCGESLKNYIEENLDSLAEYLRPLIKNNKCEKLRYNTR